MAYNYYQETFKWPPIVSKRTCEWCTSTTWLRRQFDKLCQAPWRLWPSDLLLDLQYCAECVNEYHNIRDDFILENPEKKKELWSGDIQRLLLWIKQALDDTNPTSPTTLEVLDNLESRLPAIPQYSNNGNLEQLLEVPILEVLQYPELLYDYNLCKLFEIALTTLIDNGTAPQVHQRLPGLNVLLIHPSQKLRKWAEKTLKKFKNKLTVDEYDTHSDTIERMIQVATLNLFEIGEILMEGEVDIHDAIYLPAHLYSQPSLYWDGFLRLLLSLDKEVISVKLMGDSGHKQLPDTIVNVIDSVHGREKATFWSAFNSFVIILESCGSRMWPMMMNPPDKVLDVITTNRVYLGELKNAHKDDSQPSSQESSQGSQVFRDSLPKTSLTWFQMFVSSVLDFTDVANRCVSTVIRILDQYSGNFNVKMKIVSVVSRIVCSNKLSSLESSVHLWLPHVIELATRLNETDKQTCHTVINAREIIMSFSVVNGVTQFTILNFKDLTEEALEYLKQAIVDQLKARKNEDTKTYGPKTHFKRGQCARKSMFPKTRESFGKDNSVSTATTSECNESSLSDIKKEDCAEESPSTDIERSGKSLNASICTMNPIVKLEDCLKTRPSANPNMVCEKGSTKAKDAFSSDVKPQINLSIKRRGYRPRQDSHSQQSKPTAMDLSDYKAIGILDRGVQSGTSTTGNVERSCSSLTSSNSASDSCRKGQLETVKVKQEVVEAFNIEYQPPTIKAEPSMISQKDSDQNVITIPVNKRNELIEHISTISNALEKCLQEEEPAPNFPDHLNVGEDVDEDGNQYHYIPLDRVGADYFGDVEDEGCCDNGSDNSSNSPDVDALIQKMEEKYCLSNNNDAGYLENLVRGGSERVADSTSHGVPASCCDVSSEKVADQSDDFAIISCQEQKKVPKEKPIVIDVSDDEVFTQTDIKTTPPNDGDLLDNNDRNLFYDNALDDIQFVEPAKQSNQDSSRQIRIKMEDNTQNGNKVNVGTSKSSPIDCDLIEKHDIDAFYDNTLDYIDVDEVVTVPSEVPIKQESNQADNDDDDDAPLIDWYENDWPEQFTEGELLEDIDVGKSAATVKLEVPCDSKPLNHDVTSAKNHEELDVYQESAFASVEADIKSSDDESDDDIIEIFCSQITKPPLPPQVKVKTEKIEDISDENAHVVEEAVGVAVIDKTADSSVTPTVQPLQSAPSRAAETVKSLFSGSPADVKCTLKLKEDHLTKQVLSWKVDWLDTNNRADINVYKVLENAEKLPKSFDSMDSYCTSIGRLMFIEAWEKAVKEWRDPRCKRGKTSTVILSSSLCQPYNIIRCVLSDVPSSDINRMTFPGEKDLVVLKGEEFGIIDNVHLEKIHRPNSSSDNNDSMSERTFNLTFTIRTNSYFMSPDGSTLEVQVVSSLLSTFRQWAALMSFSQQNLLAKDILRPRGVKYFCSEEKSRAVEENEMYNKSQARVIETGSEAVKQPFAIPRICLVQGPPGTGKSHTIVGMVSKILNHQMSESNQCQLSQLLPNKPRILICCPSNEAIDELIRKLLRAKPRKSHSNDNDKRKTKEKSGYINCGDFSLVRIGRTNKIHESVKEVTLENQVRRTMAKHRPSEPEAIWPLNEKRLHVKRKIDDLQKKRFLLLQSEDKKNEFRLVESDIKKLNAQLQILNRQYQAKMKQSAHSNRLEGQIKKEILSNADIVCTTLTGSGSTTLLNELKGSNGRKIPFSCVIVDEACQCTEPDILIPLQYKASKLILVGDPEQLPATVISKDAKRLLYGRSMFDRLYRCFKELPRSERPVHLLDVQYRMHPEIAHFPSKFIYNDNIHSDSSLQARSFPIKKHYMLFNVHGGRELNDGRGSICNLKEGHLIVQLCQYLLRNRLKPSDIGIITPYRAQMLELLKYSGDLMKDIEVKTVDGFQGREKNVIIMSCVRSGKNIGFLDCPHRLNVAITRARHALFVFGNLDSLEKSESIWKKLVADARQRRLIYMVDSIDDVKRAINLNDSPRKRNGSVDQGVHNMNDPPKKRNVSAEQGVNDTNDSPRKRSRSVDQAVDDVNASTRKCSGSVDQGMHSINDSSKKRNVSVNHCLHDMNDSSRKRGGSATKSVDNMSDSSKKRSGIVGQGVDNMNDSSKKRDGMVGQSVHAMNDSSKKHSEMVGQGVDNMNDSSKKRGGMVGQSVHGNIDHVMERHTCDIDGIRPHNKSPPMSKISEPRNDSKKNSSIRCTSSKPVEKENNHDNGNLFSRLHKRTAFGSNNTKNGTKSTTSASSVSVTAAISNNSDSLKRRRDDETSERQYGETAAKNAANHLNKPSSIVQPYSHNKGTSLQQASEGVVSTAQYDQQSASTLQRRLDEVSTRVRANNPKPTNPAIIPPSGYRVGRAGRLHSVENGTLTDQLRHWQPHGGPRSRQAPSSSGNVDSTRSRGLEYSDRMQRSSKRPLGRTYGDQLAKKLRKK